MSLLFYKEYQICPNLWVSIKSNIGIKKSKVRLKSQIKEQRE